MSGVYTYVMESYEEGKNTDEIMQGLNELFGAKTLYFESNLGFYFDLKGRCEITAETDGSSNVIFEVEKGQSIQEIKEEFINEVKYLTYNIYRDYEGEEILHVYFHELDNGTEILNYIFDECLKQDIECYLNEEN